MLKMRRTPVGRRSVGEEACVSNGVGDCCKRLSVRVWIEWAPSVVDIDCLFELCVTSGSGEGGHAPGIIWCVGCEVSGPPVVGRVRDLGPSRGVMGGVSSGAGMFVPSVREKSTGSTERM